MKIANKNIIFPGVFITVIYLLINLAIINKYGVTWDFSYHFNAGLWHLGRTIKDANFLMGPSPPLSDVMPVLSYLLFYEKLNILPWDSAYNLYSVIIGSLGVGILYFFARDLINRQTALFSSVILALIPRYLGHLHNNMKDIPQAIFFTLSLWFFWRLSEYPTVKNLIFASIAFAVSYNSKVNAVFVLIIALLYSLLKLIILQSRHKKFNLKFNLLNFLYFLSAPFCALMLWWPFWKNPVTRLLEASHSYTTSTTNMPILYFGKLVYSGQNVPWHYPYGILLATTPFLISVFFILGTIITFYKALNKNYPSILLILWFFIPISRYLKPQMIVIDDIRHFMEIIFPFALISAVGVNQIYILIKNVILKNSSNFRRNMIYIVIPILGLSYLVWQNISYHPYQTSYFSEIIGGIKGAKGNFDIDFWASSYKQALNWVNETTPQDSKIAVAMAPDIAELYLRPDLQRNINQTNLANADSNIYTSADYSVILNRQSFFFWYNINPYILLRRPEYALYVKDVPLVSIYRN